MAKLGLTHEFANWMEETATAWSLESTVNEERASAQALRCVLSWARVGS